MLQILKEPIVRCSRSFRTLVLASSSPRVRTSFSLLFPICSTRDTIEEKIRFFSSNAKKGDSVLVKPKLKLKKQEGQEMRRRGADIDSDQEDENNILEKVKLQQLETSKNQQKAIYATKLGAAANVGLAFSKGVIGLSISSTALIADAANSLGDVLCDGVVYYTINEARKTATPDRPWGRGKIEPLGALSVGGLLMVTGTGIGYSAFQAAMDTVMLLPVASIPPVEHFESLVATAEVVDKNISINNYAALAVSGMSIMAKEALFRYTLKIGQKANSAVVIANAWQHRADVSTSIAVFVGLIGSMMGYPILDPLAGLLVAGVIMQHAYVIGLDALRDLSDAPASEKETHSLRKTCLDVKGVLEVEELKARKSGPFLFIEATVGVDGNISASAAHRISELTRLELLNRHSGRVANAVVHVTPLGSSGLGEQYPTWARDHDFIVSEIKRAVKEIQEILTVSEVQVYYKDNGLISAKLDIVLSAHLTIHQAHQIAAKAKKVIEIQLPGIGDIDVDLELEEDSSNDETKANADESRKNDS